MPIDARITVAIPSYDGGAHLRRAVAAVLAQTRQPARIVISDDGSADDSLASIADLVAASSPAIEIIQRAKPLGLAANWNFCARSGQTPYVAVLHQDDEWLPSFLETLVAELDADPRAQAAVCNTQVRYDAAASSTMVRASDEWRRRTQAGPATADEYALLLRSMRVYPCSWVARRSLFDVEKFDESMRWACDWDFWLRVFAEPGRVVISTDALAVYHRHAGSSSFRPQTMRARIEEETRVFEQAAARGGVTPAQLREASMTLDLRLCAYVAQSVAARKPWLALQLLGKVLLRRGLAAPWRAVRAWKRAPERTGSQRLP